MTAPTTTRSAYPPAVDDLVPRAQDLADNLGRTPSRNMLMKEFRIGVPKAKAVLEALAAAPVSAPPAAAPVGDDPESPPIAPDAEPTAPAAAEPVTPATEAAEPVADLAPVAEAAPDVKPVRAPVVWPVLILCLPAFVAIWAGWVEMGRLTGFGKVALLPGIADQVVLDTAITLPIGVETYAAYALWVWLSARITGQARRFAKWSAIGSLAIGGLGQIAYHLMAAAGWDSAPWPITAVVACIPVAVLGMGAALAHLMHNQQH